MSERQELLVASGEGRAASMLTDARFQQLAAVPAELEWFANLDNPRTRRAYQADLKEFMAFVGSSLIYRFPEWASAGISARRTRSVSVSYSLVFFRPHALRFRRFSRSSMAFSANSANFRRNFPVHVDRQSSAG